MENKRKRGEANRHEDVMAGTGVSSECTSVSVHTDRTANGSRDDAKGPVTTCDLYTLEPEELLNQAFNDEDR